MELTHQVGILIAVFLLTYYFAKSFQYSVNLLKNVYRMWTFTKTIPGPLANPFFGNALTFVFRPFELANVFLEWFESYGGVFRVWIGHRLYIVLAAPEHVKQILSSTEFVDKNSDYEMLHEWLGTGVATVNGEKWFRRRKMLNKAFIFSRLSNLCDIVNEQSKVLMKVLNDEYFQHTFFDVSPVVSRCVMDILAESGMSTKLETQKSQNHEFFIASIRLAEILYEKMLRPWLCLPVVGFLSPIRREEHKCYHIIHTFTEKIIANRKLERRTEKPFKDKGDQEYQIIKKGFLDLLLDAQEMDESISDKDIRMEIATFMFGGQDTVSTNLTWVLRMISVHADVQKKIQAELDEIFGNELPGNVTLDEIGKMKYLDCVIKETLRLYPSGPIFNRILKRDVQLETGQTLPRGASVQIHAFLLHRDPKSFPNPYKFDPDRFLPENSSRHYYSYVPFSAGPRNCIGQKFAMVQEKIILAHVLSLYELQGGEEMEREEFSWDLVLRPKGGAQIKLIRRKS